MDVIGFSLESVFQLRAKAFTQIRRHAAAVDAIATELAALDTALQMSISDRNIDDQHALAATARRLATLLDGEVA